MEVEEHGDSERGLSGGGVEVEVEVGVEVEEMVI